VAAAEAFASPAGKLWKQDGQPLVKNMTTYIGHGHAVVPFENRKRGDDYFIVIGGFVFDPAYGSREKAELHYVTEHTRIAARFPGCEGYLITIVENHTGEPSEPYRLAFSIYRDEETQKSALKTPVARDLENDARGLCQVARLFFFNARVEV
jgi:hypothetical protein